MITWLHITAGRGPQECCWVVHKAVRRVLAEATDQGFNAKLIEAIPGTMPQTLSSALIAVEGDQGLAGFTAQWQGTIQWIGTSMFRPNHKRKNWFIGIAAIEPPSTKVFNPKDIRFDYMRASGPGGQHVNKTETAVRVVHIPTGLTAISREERSQSMNKKLALGRLHALIRKKDQETQTRKTEERWSHHNHLERGNAIRIFKGMDFLST